MTRDQAYVIFFVGIPQILTFLLAIRVVLLSRKEHWERATASCECSICNRIKRRKNNYRG